MRLFPIISNRQRFKLLDFQAAAHDRTAEEILEVTDKTVKRVMPSLSLPCGVIQQMIWVRLF